MNLHLGSRSDGGEQAKLKQAPRACRALFVKNMDSETSTATSTCGDSSARKTFMVSWPVLAYAAQWISRGSSPHW